MNKLARNYDRLTGDERFRLALSALARDDEAEARSLGETCPSFNCRTRDWEFHRRIDASLQVAMTLALELAPHLATVRHLDMQADYTTAALEILEPCGIDAAIEAHWQALDPDGTPDNREGLLLPDLKALMGGAAGVPYLITGRLREFWRKLRARELGNVASILEGFDRFTSEQWDMAGPEALEAHRELFEALEPYREELAALEVDPTAGDVTAEALARLWKRRTG